MAARQLGLLDILADIRPGGRIDALKAALSANSAHGIRRTNQDKRRAVEIALREFGKLSSRQIAELCGVSTDMVIDHRPQLSKSDSSKRMGADGKERPATRRTSVTFSVPEAVEGRDGSDRADAGRDGEAGNRGGYRQGVEATGTASRRGVGKTEPRTCRESMPVHP